MEFREVTTREEFAKILPVIKQDWDGRDYGGDARVIDNFIQAAQFNYRQFAVYDNDKVIAVTGMLKSFMPIGDKPFYDLVAFVVDENYRGKGVGSALVAYCKEVLLKEGARYLRTGAYTQNYKAQAFYQKNGFKHTANFMFQDIQGVEI